MHPRTLIADFKVAEQTLKCFEKSATENRFFTGVILILHPLTLLEGGLTPIEIRALAELVASAGARQVYLWVEECLSLAALSALRFSDGNGRLLYP